MTTVDNLVRDWLDVALSRPKIKAELDARVKAGSLTKPEEYKYVIVSRVCRND